MSKLNLASASAWKSLQKLRQSYLTAQGFLPDYWSDHELLEAYDQTLAQRIRWKWRAVWEALPKTELPRTLVDLGCGTGAASREVLSLAGDRFDKLVLLDRSTRALQFAAAKVREEFPECKVETRLPQHEEYFLLVSHLFSELTAEGLSDLQPLLAKAEVLLWVEPGRHQESGRLSLLRETLRATHQFLAPCPHQSLCGMLADDQVTNWCHFRAPVPKDVHHSAYWREVAKQLGIDLRSLPLAYLFAKRTSALDVLDDDKVQILAGSKTYKGYTRYHGCHRDRVFQADFMKRTSKIIYAELSEPRIESRFRREDLGKGEGHGPL